MGMKLRAEVIVTEQHGPAIRVFFNDVTVAVYLADETGIVTTDEGQYGMEVRGPWHLFRKQLKELGQDRRQMPQ